MATLERTVQAPEQLSDRTSPGVTRTLSRPGVEESFLRQDPEYAEYMRRVPVSLYPRRDLT